MLVVYTGDNCPKCSELKDVLKAKEISYNEVNVRQDAEAHKFLVSQGFRSIPQMFLDGVHVSLADLENT